MGGNTWTTRTDNRDRLRRYAPLALVAAALVIAFIVATALMRPVAANPTRPIILSSAEWAPFVGPSLPDDGPLAQLVTEVLQHQGYSPTIHFTSWTLAEEQARNGETVAVFPLVGSTARSKEYLRSAPLMDFSYVLFYDKRHRPTINSVQDLATLRVGHIAGYEYWDALNQAVDGHYIEFDTSLEAFRALAQHKIDVLPEGLLSGQAVLAGPDFGYDAADFDYVRGNAPGLHSNQSLYVMMPRTAEGQRMITSFNTGLAAIKQTDDYAMIIDAIGTPNADDVTIAADASGLVTLLDADGRVKVRSPQGTRARVLAWPGDLTPGAMVKIKVLNGPATGRVGYVPASKIRM